jgi:TP901 family phage tail tape measure protein
MSTVIGDLFVRLGVDATALDKGLGGAEKRVESFGTRMFFMGSRITAGITVPIVGAAAAVAKFGMDFDKAMTESLAIMDNITPKIRSQMEGVAIEVAKTTKFSATEAAEGFYHLASAGLDAATTMGALPIAAKFAQAGVMDLAKATDFLASAQAALGNDMETSTEKVADMAKIADVLTAANNRALGTVQDFAEALTNKSGAIMRQFNIPLEEGVAVLASYAAQGTKGRVAGQQFMMMVRDLTTQMIKHKSAFEEYKIAVFDANGNLRNMADIIHDVELATKGMNVQQQTAMLLALGIPLRSVAATRALIGYSDAIRDNEKALREAGGTTERVAAKQLEAYTNQLKLMANQVEILGIRLFQAFVPVIEHDIMPAFKALISMADTVVTAFERMPEPVKAVTLALLALAAAVGPVIAVIGSMSLLGGAAMEGLSALAGGVSTIAVQLGLAAGGSTVAAVKQVALNKAWLDASNAAFTAAEAAGLSAAQVVAASNAAGDAVLAEQALAGATMATTGEVGAFGAAIAALSNPVTATILVIGGLAAVTYYLSTRLTENEQAIIDNSKAFTEQTDKLDAAMKTYDNLGYGLSLTKEQTQKLDEATRLLAEASGLSVDAFNKEANKSDDLTRALKEQIQSRKDLADAYGEGLAATFAKERASLNNLKSQMNDVLNGKGVVAVTGTGPGGFTAPRTMNMEERIAAVKRLTAEIDKQRQVAEKAKSEYESFITLATPDSGGGPAIPHSRIPGAGGGPPLVHPEEELAKLTGQAKKVDDLFHELMGDEDSQLGLLVELWHQHSDQIRGNAGAMAELAQRYLTLRKNAHVTSDELDKVFAVQINGFQKTHHEINQFEDIMGSAGKAIAENFKDFQAAFEHMSTSSEIDAFWKMNEKGIQDLIPFFDKLDPAIQQMIKSYWAWKATSKDVTAAAAKDMLEVGNKITEMADKVAADLADKQDSLALFTDTSSDKQIKGLQRTSNKLRAEYKKQIDALKLEVMKLPEAQQFAEWERIKAIEASADKIVEAQHRENLLRLLEAEGFSKRWIRLHKDMTEAEIQTRIDARRAWNEYMKQLEDVYAMTSALGNLMTSLGHSDVGKVLADVSSASTDFLKGVDMVKYGENIQQQITGMINMANAAVKVWNMLGTIRSKAGRVAAGAMAGAEMGAAFGPWGAVIGGIVGAIAGAIKKEPRWMQVQDAWKTKFGIAITDGTAQAIEATAKAGHTFDAAQLLNLDKIIADAGGVKAGNFDVFVGKMHDMFSLLQRGEMTVDEVKDQFSKNFPAMAQYVVDMGKVADPVFLNLIDTMREFGFQTKETTDFILGQVTRMGAGLEKAIGAVNSRLEGLGDARKKLADAQKVIDDKKARGEAPGAGDKKRLADAQKAYDDAFAASGQSAAKTAEEVARLGRLTVVAFNAAIAGGASFEEALAAVGPDLDGLIKAMESLGITTDNVALKALIFQRDFANHNKELVEGISGLNDAFLAASNLGLARDPAVFKDFTDQLASQFDVIHAKVLAAGGSERDALQIIAPMLNNILDASKKYGLTIDEHTQKLIDEANSYGLINEKQLTTNEILATGFAALLQALGKDVPQALLDLIPKAQTTADGVETAFTGAGRDIVSDWDSRWKDFDGNIGKIPEHFRNCWVRYGTQIVKDSGGIADGVEKEFDNIQVDPIDIHYRYKADNELPDSAPPTAVGGITTRPQVRLVGEAGPEAIIPLSQLDSVLPEAGSATKTVNLTANITIQALDGADVARVVSSSGFQKALGQTLPRMMTDNVEGVRTNTRITLGVDQ